MTELLLTENALTPFQNLIYNKKPLIRQAEPLRLDPVYTRRDSLESIKFG
jgi:hypothetical protein